MEDVVADLTAPIGGFASAEFGEAGDVLFVLELGEFSGEDIHGGFFVLELTAFVLDSDGDLGRDVGDADGGVGGVDGLAAVAAGAVDVDFEVFWIDLDLVEGDLREDFDEGKAGLAEVVGVEWAEADEAVDAVFAFKTTVGVWGFELDDAGFNAGFVGLLALESRCFDVVFLCPTEIHALEHFGEVLCVEAADAGSEAENCIAFVVGTGETEELFKLEEIGFDGGELVGDFGLEAEVGDFEEFVEVGELDFHRLPGLDEVVELIEFVDFGAGVVGLVPDFGVVGFGFEFSGDGEFGGDVEASES